MYSVCWRCGTLLKTEVDLLVKRLSVRRDSLKNFSQGPSLVFQPVQNLRHGVWEEAIVSKEGFDGWFESSSLNTYLERSFENFSSEPRNSSKL